MNEHQKIIQQIRNKVLHPVYLLQGEEPYFIDLIARAIEDYVLEEHEKEFNQQILYGYDTDYQQLISTAKRFPMMANHFVVILREGQMMKTFEQLQPYLESPARSTILVLCYKHKKLDKRKAFYKTAMKSCVVFDSEKLKDYQLPAWIAGYVKERGYQITERNCLLISENLGNNLSKIANELEKVFISLPSGAAVTADVIERSIGISKEYNLFELQSALARKDIQKSVRITLHFADNPKEYPMQVVIAVLYSFFSKLLKLHFLQDQRSQQSVASVLGVHTFFVGEYREAARLYSARKVIRTIEQLRIYDLKSKGLDNYSAGSGELMKELVFKILH